MKYLICLFLVQVCFANSFLPDTFKAKIIESHKNMLTQKEEKESGLISFHYPENFRIEMGKNITVRNKKQTWFYQAPRVEGGKGEVTISQSSESGMAKLFKGLRHGLTENKLYKVKKINEQEYLLNFSAQFSQKIGFLTAILQFKAPKNPTLKDLNKMELTKANQQVLTFRFEELKVGVSFPSHEFVFEIPKNTNVNK